MQGTKLNLIKKIHSLLQFREILFGLKINHSKTIVSIIENKMCSIFLV
ncbi:hypothetical protein HMPREF9630_01292 [Peptoanaerobacter stomatis]|uniref:Uncharacterized protein n=1 Tax=Peptoanaerobacter stomatis TaxID=796937 RepID=V9HR06_9FIRM|nr:hypothetical protein HMPREF9630_01292 [Peptoanaerobacter stomatis]